ncbi:hypothetical protein [Polaromonas sp.]|uniref:hypothetical protein n=1 Tax=Polaromonas sp. TaxID=1869339 RepID=UPI0032660A45
MSHKTERRGFRPPTRNSNPSAGHGDMWQGNEMNQEEFYLQHQVDGLLTDEQMAQMLDLPEGDTGKTPESSEPAAAPAPASAPAPDVDPAKVVDPAPAPVVTDPPEGHEPKVILAKDGLHTIPYEKLTEARDQAREATARAAELEQEVQRLKTVPAAPAPAPAPAEPTPAATPATNTELYGDYSEEAIANGIEKVVAAKTAAITADLEARFASALAPIQKQHVDAATDQHFSTIAAAHPDFEAVAESAEMQQWIAKQPAFVRTAYADVLKKGTAEEVVELLTAYKGATGTTPAVVPAKVDPAAAAKAVIAKAGSAAPTSLSEIPAGSAAHHDEAAAMLDMSSAGLMTKFEGKSPEQIMALMNKVL